MRIELEGVYNNPVQSAIDLADALVLIAKTRSFGSHWYLLDGHKHFGPRYRSTLTLSRSPDLWIPNDAGEELKQMGGRSHAALDPLLVEAMRRLQETGQQLGPTSLLLDVSIIENMATACGTHWVDHMRNNLSQGWALRRMRKELFETVHQAAVNNQLPEIARMLGHDEGQYFMQHMRESLTYITDVIEALPDGLVKLEVMDMKSKTKRPGSLRRWFAQLLEEHLANVETLHRCRNSLMHGGPTHPEVVYSTARFAHRQASETLMVALNGNIGGKSVMDSHERHVAEWSARGARLRSAKTSKDALYGETETE